MIRGQALSVGLTLAHPLTQIVSQEQEHRLNYKGNRYE